MLNRIALAAVLALGLIGLLPERAMAWGAEGHRVACEIAWLRLTPEARRMVVDLLRDEPDPVFARTCVWADEVRGTTHRHTAAYHYINIPGGVAGVDLRRDCGNAEQRCVTWAIDHYARILGDRSRPHAERNEALKFVGHFVGDLHQPLHAGRPEDLGANRVLVSFFGDAGTAERPLNLHSVWDSAILRRSGLRWPESAGRLHEAVTPLDVERWHDVDVMRWTNESYRIADRFVYGELPADNVITTCYYAPALGYSELRLQQAGVRLAYMLNHIAAGTLQLPRLPI